MGPPDIAVTEGMPATIDIRLIGGPDQGEFDIVMAFDPGVVVPTAVRFGDGNTDATVSVTGSPSFAGSGRIRLKGEFRAGAPAPDSPGSAQRLAAVTIAPVSAGTAAISVAEASMRDADGGALSTITTGTALATVVAAPSSAGVEGALRQSMSLTATSGFGVPALGGLADDLLGTLKVQGWTLLWLGVLLTSLALVGVGWLMGRPRPAPGHTASTVRWTRDDDSAAETGVRIGPVGPKP